METIYLFLREQVAVSTFFMNSPVGYIICLDVYVFITFKFNLGMKGTRRSFGGKRSLNKVGVGGGGGHMYTQREIISFVFKQYIGINYLQKLKMH